MSEQFQVSNFFVVWVFFPNARFIPHSKAMAHGNVYKLFWDFFPLVAGSGQPISWMTNRLQERTPFTTHSLITVAGLEPGLAATVFPPK